MEQSYFQEVRSQLCLTDSSINPGKMMSSEAVTYKGKVFAFFSRKKKLVVKLGKEFDPDSFGLKLSVFNPFKNRAPMQGWFEVPYSEKEQWMPLAKKALLTLQKSL